MTAETFPAGLREAIARAIGPVVDAEFDDESISCAKSLNAVADAALQAIAKQGYVVVPREPTQEMVRAGYASDPKMINVSVSGVYRAMTGAATPPTPEKMKEE